VAVVFEGQSLTYRELNARANRLAQHLRTLGVGPEVLVGLCVERSLEMVVGLLGILKAGGAYLPLDPALPHQRLAFLLSDAACTIVITQNSWLAVLTPKSPPPEISPLLVVLDAMPLESCLEVGANLVPSAAPNHLAYVIYTSGSTGKPKGVEIPHRALVNCLCHFQRSLEVAPHDVWLTVTTLSFDIAGLEIWLPLLAGARVVIGPRETAIDGRLLSQALIDSGATILQATPTTWRMLLQSGWQGHPNLQILCGGEAIPQELADCLAVLGSRAWNLYGPTETTIWSTTKQLIPNRPVSIGSPLANTQVYVLDSRNQPMPIGVVGDLCIGGDGVARGYRNRPELTAERFVQDPFSDKLGARLYRTGDLARWLPDGNLEFLGRLDQQVKIRGHRIELGEVEAVLGGHLEVASCAVLAQDLGGGDKTLVAFVVGRAGAEPSVGSLRQWLGEKLPHYMVPSRFVAVPALPLTPNGKLDRKALENLDGEELAVGTDYLAPRNEWEGELVEIWQAVLRRERVGIQDNFFELGGHSLLAVVICSQIQRRLGLEVPLRWVFEHPTIEGLARQLESLGRHSQDTGAIEKADRQKPLPMSFAQQGMWLLQQTLPDPA
ncbi:MAG: amino acid adenylation domain-containing protein, partial [Verrucomicrobiota bacterium]